MNARRDYYQYQVLGAPPDTEATALKKAFRQLAARLRGASAVPGRYLPLQVAGLRLANSRLTIYVYHDGYST